MRHPEEPVTVVVGASGHGIGPAVAERLGKEHHRVVLVGRNGDRLRSLEKRLSAAGATVMSRSGDATKTRKVRRIVDDVLLHWGRLDNVVYVPAGEAFGGLMATTEEGLEDHLRLSVVGPFLWMQATVPHMHRERGGRFIFMSATSGKRGFAGMLGFSAAKFGLHGLVESFSREYREEGISAATIVLDGMLDHPGMRERYPDKEDWSDTIDVDMVADAVSYLLRQDERALTHEFWLTPGRERW